MAFGSWLPFGSGNVFQRSWTYYVAHGLARSVRSRRDTYDVDLGRLAGAMAKAELEAANCAVPAIWRPKRRLPVPPPLPKVLPPATAAMRTLGGQRIGPMPLRGPRAGHFAAGTVSIRGSIANDWIARSGRSSAAINAAGGLRGSAATRRKRL